MIRKKIKRGVTLKSCAYCGIDFMARNDSIKRGMGRFCSKSCQVKDQHCNGTNKAARKMEKHHWWKGGRIEDLNGYILIRIPDHHLANSHGYVLEHRLVVEQKIGRPLKSDEIIHHIDEDKTNNDPLNLEIHSRSSHMALHRKPG